MDNFFIPASLSLLAFVGVALLVGAPVLAASIALWSVLCVSMAFGQRLKDCKMQKYIKYFNYVIRHKWFVLLEGRKLGLGWWQLLVHDLSKFSSEEFGPYARFFFGDEPSSKTGGPVRKATPEFEKAWKHHWKNNPHHWEFWQDVGERSPVKAPFEMPFDPMCEMLADWRGAGRAITGVDNTLDWYLSNRDKIKLHPDTRSWIETMLGVV